MKSALVAALLVVACRGVDSPDPIPPDARVVAADAGRPDGPFMCGAGETICNDIASDFPPECCTNEVSHCCPVGYEHEGCVPIAEPCGEPCPRSLDDHCPPGHLCLVTYPASGGPPPGECEPFPEVDYSGCTEACAPDSVCGGECCATNAVCVDGCCVPVG